MGSKSRFPDTAGNHQRVRGIPRAEEKSATGMTLNYNFLKGLESRASSGVTEGQRMLRLHWKIREVWVQG